MVGNIRVISGVCDDFLQGGLFQKLSSNPGRSRPGQSLQHILNLLDFALRLAVSGEPLYA